MGCAILDAAEYFSRIRDLWNDYPYGPLPQLRPLVHKIYPTPNLIAYQAADTQDGLQVNGIAYSPIPNDTVLLEVAMPRSDRSLATTILDFLSSRLR